MRRSWLARATSTLALTTVLTTALTTGSACDPFNRTVDNAGDPAGGSGGAAGVSAAPAGGTTAGDGGDGGDDGSQFCALAKQKGAQNLEVFDGQSETPEQQRQVLLNIDALTAAAPVEIHADFVRFDQFEHKLFDAGGQATGDLAQEAGGPELRDSLARIGTYLDQRCGIHS